VGIQYLVFDTENLYYNLDFEHEFSFSVFFNAVAGRNYTLILVGYNPFGNDNPGTFFEVQESIIKISVRQLQPNP
jgi:hypothetical protein